MLQLYVFFTSRTTVLRDSAPTRKNYDWQPYIFEDLQYCFPKDIVFRMNDTFVHVWESLEPVCLCLRLTWSIDILKTSCSSQILIRGLNFHIPVPLTEKKSNTKSMGSPPVGLSTWLRSSQTRARGRVLLEKQKSSAWQSLSGDGVKEASYKNTASCCETTLQTVKTGALRH